MFFWEAYLPIENTPNGKRPRLVHRPRAGPWEGPQVRVHVVGVLDGDLGVEFGPDHGYVRSYLVY
jgi:hypothetical protein